jgi:hypothetical protein
MSKVKGMPNSKARSLISFRLFEMIFLNPSPSHFAPLDRGKRPQREEKYFPPLEKGDEGGFDI